MLTFSIRDVNIKVNQAPQVGTPLLKAVPSDEKMARSGTLAPEQSTKQAPLHQSGLDIPEVTASGVMDSRYERSRMLHLGRHRVRFGDLQGALKLHRKMAGDHWNRAGRASLNICDCEIH